MNQDEIKKFFESHLPLRERTIVIVDFGNVEKWKNNLNWSVGIRELGSLIKHFTYGRKFLRRFYYGADFGPNEKAGLLTPWSRYVLQTAESNGFEVIEKRVKYIDLVTALRYLKDAYKKKSIVISARGHIGKEVIDANRGGAVETILWADDFEYRLNMKRFMRK